MSTEGAWLAQLLENLEQSGPVGQSAATYIRQRGVRLGVHSQSTGARWRAGQRIELHPSFAAGSPSATYPLSLLVHEVIHLEQGALTALSVYGELMAWQGQFDFIRAQTGKFHENPQKDRDIGEICGLPLGWDREILATARRLMRQYAGPAYRVDLLPLYPLPQEVIWIFTHTKPKAWPQH